ncbi:hypothetical protein ACFL35_11580 [Candidatus Riflebacteria bacterium]
MNNPVLYCPSCHFPIPQTDKPDALQHCPECKKYFVSKGSGLVKVLSFEELTQEHRRLLALLACYCPRPEKTHLLTWIKNFHLMILIFDGINKYFNEKPIFEYDYSPVSLLWDNKRVIVNISQEGKDDLDDLLEGGLLKALKLPTSSFHSLSAFTLTDSGREYIEKIPEEDKKAVLHLIFCPQCQVIRDISYNFHDFEEDGNTFAKLEVFYFCPKCITMKAISAFSVPEDISYVASPFVPQSLLGEKLLLKSNASLIDLIRDSGDSIKDQSFSEEIVLAGVHLILNEYVPFGANQMVNLNLKLGSEERVQGGFFTQKVDPSPNMATIKSEAPPTEVTILNNDLSEFILFLAKVDYPTEEHITQIEEFGVYIPRSGFITYGIFIDASKFHGVFRGKDSVSLDALGRIKMDVETDSTEILSNLITDYQQSILEFVFFDNEEFRDKFVIITAEKIIKGPPSLKAEDFFDRENYENEMKQILGNTKAAYNLDENDLLFVGSHGMLLISQEKEKYEFELITYSRLRSLGLFIHNYFVRSNLLTREIDELRDFILTIKENPENVGAIRQELSDCSASIVLMEETLYFFKDSLADEESELNKRVKNENQFHGFLKIPAEIESLEAQLHDLEKIISAQKGKLKILQEMTAVIRENQNFRMQESMSHNTRSLQEVHSVAGRQEDKLQIMQQILAGALAFDIMDRLTGEWSVMDLPWAKKTFGKIVDFPLAWFFVSLLFWFFISFLLYRFMKYIEKVEHPNLQLRMKLNLRCSISKLKKYLVDVNTISESSEKLETHIGDGKAVIGYVSKSKWRGTFRGQNPLEYTGEISYRFYQDKDDGLLLDCFLNIPNPGTLTEDEAQKLFLQELEGKGIIFFEKKWKHDLPESHNAKES